MTRHKRLFPPLALWMRRDGSVRRSSVDLAQDHLVRVILRLGV